MDNKNPKISIIMGIYNCADTLREAIDSIIEQTYTNWELIMCDDCSKDNTVDIAKEYVKKYPDKIKLLVNETNITLAPTLNRCLKHVTGKYIARQDGDDISDKERLAIEVDFLEKNTQFDLVGTSMISFDETGQKGVHRLKAEPSKDDLLKGGSTFSHATILIKTSIMKDLNGYSEKWYANQAEDYELWFRFFLKGYRGYNLDESLYYVRENISTYKRKNIKRRLRGIVLNLKIYTKMRAPIYSYLNIFKDIIAILVPRGVFIRYYRWKLNN